MSTTSQTFLNLFFSKTPVFNFNKEESNSTISVLPSLPFWSEFLDPGVIAWMCVGAFLCCFLAWRCRRPQDFEVSEVVPHVPLREVTAETASSSSELQLTIAETTSLKVDR